MGTGLVLTERDMQILHQVSRFKFCLGRQIRRLASFSGERACDRRLSRLIEYSYLERKHILYGIPGIYFLGKNARHIGSVKYYSYRIKLDEITHDIAVVDTVIFLLETLEISLSDITSERELHSIDGFSNRKHRPDFVFSQNEKSFCVEIEFSQKSKRRLEDILKDNFLEYSAQIWIVPKNEHRIRKIITESGYPDIRIIDWEVVEKNVRRTK